MGRKGDIGGFFRALFSRFLILVCLGAAGFVIWDWLAERGNALLLAAIRACLGMP